MNQTVTINGQPFCCSVVGGIQPNGVIGIVSAGACSVTPPPGGNPATLTHSNIGYGTVTGSLRGNVDITEWANLFGYTTPSPTEPQATVWPGKSGSGPTIMQMRSTDIVVLHFRTPPHAQMPKSGSIGLPRRTNAPLAQIDLCIALAASDAGNFRNPVNAGALQLGHWTDDNTALSWIRDDQAHNNTKAILSPDTDYYMAVRFSAGTNAPPAVSRPLLMLNNFGSP